MSLAAPSGRPLQWAPLLALWSCALSCALLPLSAAWAQAQPAAALADARGWLTRIHNAASTANYQGTLVFSGGGVLSSSRVWHYSLGEQTYERLEALDGRQQQIVRHNDAVHTLWPQTRVAVLERRETLAAWSTTPQSVDPAALDQYELRREGSGRVAGREADVLLLEPRDALRYAQRLWADKTTGLMLRADIMAPAPAGAVGAPSARTALESTAFSQVEIGVKPQPEQVLQPVRRLDGYRLVRPQQQRTTLQAEGWVLARAVPGFQLAGCVKRGMYTAGDESPVLQSVFTDGLTHVSLFVEPYKPHFHHHEIQVQQGATATAMLRRGEHWITVVGDVPPATLAQFAEALERRPP